MTRATEQRAFLHQHQDGDGGQRLGHRGHAKQRAGLHWPGGVEVGETVRFDVHDPASPRHERRDAEGGRQERHGEQGDYKAAQGKCYGRGERPSVSSIYVPQGSVRNATFTLEFGS